VALVNKRRIAPGGLGDDPSLLLLGLSHLSREHSVCLRTSVQKPLHKRFIPRSDVGLNTTNFNKALSAGKAMTHPQQSSCPETPASEASGLLDAVTKVFGETERSRPVVVRSLTVLSLDLMALAAKTQTVINFPMENLLVGGSIYLNLSQGGWTL
jgi:hypothetical protein